MTDPRGHRVPRWRRWWMQRVARLLVGVFSRTEVRGLEKLPRGCALIAPNHLGHADPLLLLATLDNPPEVIALADLVRKPAAPLVWLYQPILVKRDRYDRTVVERALATVESGERLLLFPEARISLTGALERARSGVGYLALKAGVPVVPVALTGTENAKHHLLRGRRPRFTLTMGEPIYPHEIPEHSPREQRAWLTTELMTRIAALLPPAYRGVYDERLERPGDSE